MDDNICTTPLSSPYAFLPRIHLYLMVLSLIIPLPKGWLFRAALAGFTTKTAIFAVDAIVHLSHLRRGGSDDGHHALPLELVVTLEMLALACLVAVWLLMVSRTASASGARFLVKGWCVAVAVATVVAFVGVKEMGAHAGRFLTGEEGCKGVIMPRESIFGQFEDGKIAGMGVMGTKIADILRFVGIPGLVFAALTIAFISAKGPAGDLAKSAKTIDLESTPTNFHASPDIIQPKPSILSFAKLVTIFRSLLMGAVPAMCVIVVQRTEMYLFKMRPDVPESEPMASVGQWGVWAATGVVFLGTLLNAAREGMGYTSSGDVGTEKARL